MRILLECSSAIGLIGCTLRRGLRPSDNRFIQKEQLNQIWTMQPKHLAHALRANARYVALTFKSLLICLPHKFAL